MLDLSVPVQLDLSLVAADFVDCCDIDNELDLCQELYSPSECRGRQRWWPQERGRPRRPWRRDGAVGWIMIDCRCGLRCAFRDKMGPIVSGGSWPSSGPWLIAKPLVNLNTSSFFGCTVQDVIKELGNRPRELTERILRGKHIGF